MAYRERPNFAELDLDGNDSTTTGDNYITTYTENNPAVTIADTDATLTDVENQDVTLQIVAANIANGTNEILNFGGSQIPMDGVTDANLNNVTVGGVIVDVTYTAATQTFVITDGSGAALPLADALAVIKAITYQNDSENPSSGTARTFTITANDGTGDSDPAVSTVNVVAVNDAPVNTVPTAQSVAEDTLLNITGISVNDVDGNLATTQLTVTDGDLNVSLAGGATISAGANGSSTLTLSGTQTQINAALATLTYQGDLNFNGSDTLTVLSTDSAGVPLSDTDAITITVTPISEPAVLDLDANNSSGATGNDFTKTIIPTGAGVAATSIVDTDVTITDVDDTNIESATIILTNAKAGDALTVGALPAGITANVVGNTVGLTGTATLADYQTALQAISFSNSLATVDGTDRTITFTVNDGETNSAIATTTLDVFGTPTVNTLVTADTEPTLTGTWDEADATATGLQVTVDGTTYTLGTDAALTSDGSGNWTLNLTTAGQTLAVNTFDVSITTTDGTNNVADATTNELRVITTPEWDITGDSNVTEGNNASYTISLTGAELLSAGETVSVTLSTADITAIVGTDTGALDAAVTAAIGARTDLTYNAGTNTLTYTAPSNPYTATYDNTTANFNDISGTGTVVSLGDDASSSQAIGFNFDFYGTTYTNAFVGSNGLVTFGGGASEYGNDDLSASGLMNTNANGWGTALPGIAAFWDDLNPNDGDSNDVFVQQTTEGGVNVLIIQYDDIVPWGGGSGNRGTFQVVLFEGSNDIEVRYLDVNFASGNANGASATIGVSDGTTTNFTQHSYNSASIADNSNIRYTQPTVAMTDLVIDLSAVVDAPDGPENYSVSIGSATGSSALGDSTSVTTTIYDVDTPPTLTATPDAGITFTEE